MMSHQPVETPSPEAEELAPRQLSKPQRRVLGVLLEKSFTTPESYPLTLKALATGCNQKSNRSPLSSYEESDVYDTLEELRALGLVAVVHTAGGRTERFRHYARKKYSFSEPQLAILTELLLRGRQTLGELRARASRMVPIDSLGDLRQELDALFSTGYLQASAPLDRRGTEVDHLFYAPNENQDLPLRNSETLENRDTAGKTAPNEKPATSSPSASSVSNISVPNTQPGSADPGSLTREVQKLRDENQQLKEDVGLLQTGLQEVVRQMEEIRRDLGM